MSSFNPIASPAIGKWSGRAALLTLAILASSLWAPELLAFPYRATVGDTMVYAERPIGPALHTVVGRSNQLLHASPIFSAGYGRRIFLTSGGWRWWVLSIGTGGSFAFTRRLGEAIVVNRSSVAQDRVFNAQAIGGVPSLSGVIAHERTHSLLRHRYGLWIDRIEPAWKIEGYCDYVAQESSLTDADVAALRAAGKSHPALVYDQGRRRVAELLAVSHGKVDALFK